MDGEFCYCVDVTDPLALAVESNGSAADFARLFRLEESLADIAREVGEADDRLAPYVAKRAGLRIMRQTDAVETAMSFLCTANNHMGRIVPMVEALVELGQMNDEFAFRRFPELEVIADLDEEFLRGRGFGYRGKTIPAAARFMLDKGGRGWLEGLRARPYAETVRELLDVPGIGPKLADCIALFGLHHMEAVPVDTHVWQAVCRQHFPEFAGKAVTERRYREIGDLFRAQFGKRAGWAQQMMFFDNFERRRGR